MTGALAQRKMKASMRFSFGEVELLLSHELCFLHFFGRRLFEGDLDGG